MKAFELHPITIRMGVKRRAWMDESPSKFAYHCLPLVVANEAGFDLILRNRVESVWDGGMSLAAVKATYPACTNFGGGIVTFHVDCIFRTNPGVQLQAGGPPNTPKDGIYPLTGIVETSWAPVTFTMNYQHTRPGTVVWEEGESFCHVLPVMLGLADNQQMVSVEPLPADVREQYAAWAAKRGSSFAQTGQRDLDYTKGRAPGGMAAPDGEHYKRVRTPG